MHKRLVPALLALVVPALAMTACGSADEKALNHSALVAKANTICNAARKESLALNRSNPNVTLNSKAGEVYIASLRDLVQKERGELAALKPDGKAKRQWDAVLEVVTKNADLIGQLAVAAKAGDTAKMQQLASQGQALTAKMDAAATTIGATGCTSTPGG